MNHTEYKTLSTFAKLEASRKGEVHDAEIVEPAWLYNLSRKTGEITEREGTFLRVGKHTYFFVKDTDDFYEHLPKENTISGLRFWSSNKSMDDAKLMFKWHFNSKTSKLVAEIDKITEFMGKIH